MTPAEVLRKAAEYLATRGWKQNTVGEHGGPRCAVGSIWSASGWTGNRADLDTLVESAWNEMEAHLGVPSLARWNDERGRTREEVIAKLREVADKLDAEAAK